MSKSLLVILSGVHLNAEREATLRGLYTMAVSKGISPSTAGTLRLVIRHGPVETTLEPFVAAASFQALLESRKKRTQTMTMLTFLVESACGNES